MGAKAFLSKYFASYIQKQDQKWMAKSVESQQTIFRHLLQKAASTKFGQDHKFSQIQSYEEYKERVPIRDYEGLRPYVEEILKGKKDILWPGMPLYFAKTSGTTSGVKYIPISKDSISNHINSARNAILNYIHQSGNTDFVKGKMIFLSGSPELTKTAGVNTGRLSGISNHHVPGYLRSNQLPSFETNCVEDWEEKLDLIIGETLDQPMSLISGIPPWVQMYFDRIQEHTGKYMKDVFPDFSLFIYGGVNFSPYRQKLFESIGKQIDSLETFPASEGFFAYQDRQGDPGLLLMLNSGIFFEFIPADEIFNERPTRLSIGQVEMGVNYALIVNSNAGLWGYNIGDTVKFVSLDPYKVVVTGRTKHFISAFGEHVIAQEVEKAMTATIAKYPETQLVEFTVAPNVTPETGEPHHEWWISFDNAPNDLSSFEKELNLQLQQLNTYYDDLITGNILKCLEIRELEKDAFRNYMETIGKLGGQNKVPRLSNDRKIADGLKAFLKK